MKDVAAPALAKLRARPGTRHELHLVLEEDEYESKFGDGRFLYPRGAFLEPGEAARFRDGRAKREMIAWHVETVVVVRDEMKNQLTMDGDYSLKDILALLA